MRLPSTNPVTLVYGATSAPYTPAAPHAGTDYAGSDLNSYAPEEVTITAFYPQAGTPNNPCGNQLDMVSIDGTRRYRFCHSSEVYAQVGKTYPEGATLAKEGQVGEAYGVHLHVVMWVNGNRVDPDATIKQLIGGSMATDSLNEGEITAIYQLAFDNGDIPDDLIKAYKGKSLDGYVQQLQSDPSYQAHYDKVNNPPSPAVTSVLINDVPYVEKV